MRNKGFVDFDGLLIIIVSTFILILLFGYLVTDYRKACCRCNLYDSVAEKIREGFTFEWYGSGGDFHKLNFAPYEVYGIETEVEDEAVEKTNRDRSGVIHRSVGSSGSAGALCLNDGVGVVR